VGNTARSLALVPEDTVAEAVLRSAHGLMTLQRFGIDACCGGHLTLAQAAASAGVPVKTLLCALEPLVSSSTA
jgi:iron-sulfur cluster repair protein YtfE (RIC family)